VSQIGFYLMIIYLIFSTKGFIFIKNKKKKKGGKKNRTKKEKYDKKKEIKM